MFCERGDCESSVGHRECLSKHIVQQQQPKAESILGWTSPGAVGDLLLGATKLAPTLVENCVMVWVILVLASWYPKEP